MLHRARILALAAAISVAWGCGPTASSSEAASGLDASKPSTTITLPDGETITAEIAATPKEQAQGMMFRTSLRSDEGMLFPFEEMAPRGFWMFQCVIPLDIVWLDDNKRVVEISARTPPCRATAPSDCPTYGGKAHSTYVLEMASGQVAARGIAIGDQLEF